MNDTIDAFVTADAAIHDQLSSLPGVVSEIAWDDATRTYRLDNRNLIVTTTIDDDTGDYTGWEWTQQVDGVISGAGVTGLVGANEACTRHGQFLARGTHWRK